MPLDPLFDKEKVSVARPRDSFPTAPLTDEVLRAEFVEAYKKHEATQTPLKAILTTGASTSSVAIFMKPAPETARLSETWISSAWRLPSAPEHGCVLEKVSFPSPTQILTQKETSVTELIGGLRGQNIPYAARLTARLQYLVQTSEEEFPEQEPMSSRSLQDLLYFIRSVPNITYPALVLTSQGNIRAEWTKERRKHFAVEFLGSNDVRFVVFAPDRKRPHKTNRVSGLSTLDSLMEFVQPYGVFTWVVKLLENAAAA
ncbi:MAG: hypothetical protein MN733_15765 [Nitrososphaera sp.]|nr:hypothetical protein [Nitrososphaera sp.]